MSNITVRRFLKKGSAVFGYIAINASQYFTLEKAYKMVPDGKYNLGIHNSPKFKRTMPHILDVPDKEYILIHGGNEIGDTDGCLLVGRKADITANMIGNCDGIQEVITLGIQEGDFKTITFVNDFCI